MGDHRLLLRLCKKKSTTHFCAMLLFLVEITGLILITVTLLQSMHGGLPAELNPHSFGSNKKSTAHFCAVLFLSGGDYRDRTGDLLHAMQALSQLS